MLFDKNEERDTLNEQLINGNALEDDELQQVSGGYSGVMACLCSNCGRPATVEVYSYCECGGKFYPRGR